MSFEKINNNNLDKIHNRKCIMLVNFNKKELSLIKNISNFAGIRDHIILSEKNGENIIRDILDGNISSECENGIKSKSVIFNNTPSTQVNAFLEGLKKVRINRPFTAMVTETSIDWTLNNLIENLVQERNAMSLGKTIEHK
ncbi:DUF3783 domain-containing protein [Clostridioides difficile]|uniref:DUF3783 domain-containing protein n=1 Tax=Clostridioides difficile TaxID=1496 RepID=UPI001C196263|nr:DUF3783 domain-containing protein [Clostridioides difficile]MBZ1161012.1 DUF3783 domain-containing protein [Clostridioides difficile]MCL6884895.1 DUF3783 domain-containing protein [Clostridioides difficile]MCR1642754.1 DUF3783 domain-containing protein [Clostridioides difficile]MCZ1114048.1 DUF3783 domain-containing protein [Clostridioides difficile]